MIQRHLFTMYLPVPGSISWKTRFGRLPRIAAPSSRQDSRNFLRNPPSPPPPSASPHRPRSFSGGLIKIERFGFTATNSFSTDELDSRFDFLCLYFFFIFGSFGYIFFLDSFFLGRRRDAAAAGDISRRRQRHGRRRRSPKGVSSLLLLLL